MSLIIKFITDNDSEIQEPNNGLFRFEIWRKSLWGSPIILKLGCEIIPTLENTDIFAIEEDLQKLKNDLLLINTNLKEISNHTKVDEESIKYRILNALEFIKIAEENNHIIGVYIG